MYLIYRVAEKVRERGANLAVSAEVKDGHANFFVNPQIKNPQILGLIPQSQMKNRKFVRKKAVFLIQIRIGLPLIFILPTYL
jgi:hypothetical protein